MTRSLAFLFAVAFATAAAAGPGKKEADRAIADLRNAKEVKVRAAALADIGRIGQVQKALIDSAADDVAKCLTDKDPVVRAAAAKCYGMIDPDPKEAVPALLKLAADVKEKHEVRMAAVQGLGAMGAAAKPALPELNKLYVKDPDPADRPARQFRGAIQDARRSITQKR